MAAHRGTGHFDGLPTSRWKSLDHPAIPV